MKLGKDQLQATLTGCFHPDTIDTEEESRRFLFGGPLATKEWLASYEQALQELIMDDSSTLRDKCMEYVSGYQPQDEREALEFWKNIWRISTGKPWPRNS